MSKPDAHDVHTRAHQLPEEVAAGGAADPELSAELILDDSLERTEHPEKTGAESSQTIPEVDPSK
jgi:hypothetical protein